MPMPIHKPDEYDKVVNVSWYTPEKPREELRYLKSSKEPTTLQLTGTDFPVFCPFRRCIRSAV